MLDIAKRINIGGSTVGEVIDALSKFPRDAVFGCCGEPSAFIHVEEDESAVSIDWDDLEDYYLED